MPNLIIEMTEAELFALDTIAKDKQDWADNVLTDRARVAIADLKSTEAWTQSVAALAQEGGDVSDDEAVLLKGRDIEVILTAAKREEIRQENENLVPATPVLNPLDVPLTNRQINRALVLGAGITEPDAFIRAALAAIKDDTKRALALIDWEGATNHHRTSEYFNDPDMLVEAGMDSEKVDQLWALGVTLPA